MKRLILLFFILFSIVLNAQNLVNPYVSNSSPPPGDAPDYNPTFTAGTYPVTAGGDEYYAILLPTRYYSSTNSSEYYPTVYWFNGDGGDGDPTVVSAQSLSGSGTGPYTGNFTNGTRDVIWGTVVIKVSGVEVARGQWNETILGDGVTGTFEANGSNGAISVTFDATPAATPTVDYVYTPTSVEGIPKYLYEGDTLDGNTIVVVIHKAADNTFYDLEDHFQDPSTYLQGLYRIDPNRQIVAGLSRGGRASRDIFSADYTHIAGALVCATSSSGASIPWSSIYDRGLYWIGGQSDATEPSPHGTYLNTLGTTYSDYRYQPWWLFVNDQGHDAVVWNTNFANRSTAPVDWVKWASRWNLNVETQAEQNVEIAETSMLIDDYRFAKRAVSHLTAGATKTALEGRLATLKTSMDAVKRRWYIDAGATTDSETGMNNAATFTTGTSYLNLVDDNGTSSGVDFQIVSQMHNTGTGRVTTNVRTEMAGFGFKNENYVDYSTVNTAVTTGQVKWYGLDNAKTYDVTFYSMGASSTSTNDTFLETTLGGNTKTIYNMLTNVLKIEYTNITPSSNEIVIDVKATGSTTTSGVNVYMLEENQ